MKSCTGVCGRTGPALALIDCIVAVCHPVATQFLLEELALDIVAVARSPAGVGAVGFVEAVEAGLGAITAPGERVGASLVVVRAFAQATIAEGYPMDL